MNFLRLSVATLILGVNLGTCLSIRHPAYPLTQLYKISSEETVKSGGNLPRDVKNAMMKKILAASDESFERVLNKTSFSSEISMIGSSRFQILKSINLIGKQVAAFCIPQEKFIVMSDQQSEQFFLKLIQLNHERIHCEFDENNEGLAELMGIILAMDYGIAHNDRLMVSDMFRYLHFAAYDEMHGFQMLGAIHIAGNEHWRIHGMPFELVGVFQAMQKLASVPQDLTLDQASRGSRDLERFMKIYFSEHRLEYVPDESPESLRKHVLSCLFVSWGDDCHPGDHKKPSWVRKRKVQTYSLVSSRRIVIPPLPNTSPGTPMMVFEPLPADPNPLALLILEGHNHAVR